LNNNITRSTALMLFETIKKALLPVAIADNLAGHFAAARHAFSVAAGTINKLLLCSFG